MNSHQGKIARHALVIGGSLAGLFSARVLSDYFDHVTILERDPVHDFPESRKGQPQTIHLHALLAQGLDIMKRFFPGIEDSLVEGGALIGDIAEKSRWYQFGGYKVHFTSGLIGMVMSRPFLEWHIRQRVLALPNVTLRASCAAGGLTASADRQRIIGVEITDRARGNQTESLPADLVVDASGRGSSSSKWLASLDYAEPKEEEVKIKVGYATRYYRRDAEYQYSIMVSVNPPRGKRGAYLFPIEQDRWVVTAGGFHGDYPPSDEAGFLAFLCSLDVPDIYNIINRAEPLSEIYTYRYPASLRRHYERLKYFPERYLVIGDAFASFNPIYGQGITSAAMQAQALDNLLKQRRTLQRLWRPFFKRAAQVISIPWQMAVGEDFRYPETEGRKSMLTDFLNAYTAKVQVATQRDTVVYGQFLRVLNLLEPPIRLITPRILWRVWQQQHRKRKAGRMLAET